MKWKQGKQRNFLITIIFVYTYVCACMWFANEVQSFLLHNKTPFNSKMKYFEMLKQLFQQQFYSFCVVSLLMNAGGSFLCLI